MSATTSTSTSARPARDVRTDIAALRRALDVDAAISSACGVVFAAGSAALAEPLGIPSGWLLGLGLFMVVYGADLALIRRRVADAGRPSARRAVRAVAIGNAGWVAASVGAVLLGAWDLTGVGVAVVLAQAAVVEWFVLLQWRASRA